MNISEIKFIVPNKANPIGSLSFKCETPILYDEGRQMPSEDNELDVKLSSETIEIIHKVVGLIVKDISKNNE